MNIYKQLNILIEYIENNLCNEIDYKKLAKIIGTNSYTMQRFFMLLTNITITEYIKKRKISLAVADLYKKEKIIDIATKYGYNSSIAFSRAFTKMHGINPSKVINHNHDLNIFPKLKFEENNSDINLIKYKILNIKEYKIHIIEKETKLKYITQISEPLWDYVKKEIKEFNNVNKRYGIVDYKDIDKGIVYYGVGLDIPFKDSIEFIIPKGNYLVFEMTSFKAKDIDKKSTNLVDELFPSLGFKINQKFDLEVYYNNHLELWYKLD